MNNVIIIKVFLILLGIIIGLTVLSFIFSAITINKIANKTMKHFDETWDEED